jgi:Tol biopolymer transport system component
MPNRSEPHGLLADGISDRLVRSQLSKILANEIFSRSERLSAFLRFVVEETLAGRGTTLKEQVLALALYGRRPDSTSDDSIVRTDARRLRDKLRAYYSENGHEPIVILLPKGSYTPVFERNPGAAVPSLFELVTKPEREVDVTGPRVRLNLWLAGAVGVTIAGCIIAWRVWNTSIPVPQVVPLTQDAGGELDPSLSPDGNFVAYAWTGPDSPGPQDIWIKDVAGESRRRLTETPAPISENSPAWSPDGREIAFARVGYAGKPIPNPGVYIVSVLGGPERKVSPSGRNPKWTPGGHELLIRDHLDSSRPAGIFLVDLQSLRRRQVTQPSSGYGDWKFDLSPDGTTIAFIRYERAGVADIHTVPMAGGEPRRLTDWSASISGLTWTPDGREIIFDVAGQSLRRIAARTTSPGKGTLVSSLASLVTSAALASQPSISRPAPGRPWRLAFQVEVVTVGLRMIDLEAPLSAGVLQVTRFLEARRVDIPGPWSPDGEKYAFVSYSARNPAQFWVVKRDGTDLRQIKSVMATQIELGAWSPDGRQIAFDAAVGGNSDIYVVNENGGESERLTNDPSMDVWPSWSRDGRWIYYSSDKTGRHEVWKLPAQGGEPTQITRDGGVQPAESLDGKYVFHLDAVRDPSVGLPRTVKLKMTPVEGGEERTVIEITRLGRVGLWGITSRGVFFVTPERDFEAVDLYRLPEGQISRVGRLPFQVPKAFPRIAFSRDGRWAMTNQVDRRESDLMMIENFR